MKFAGWYKSPVLQLVLLTLLLQSSNFIFDWKTIEGWPGVRAEHIVNIGDNRHYFGIAKNLLLGKGYTALVNEPLAVRQGTATYVRTPGLPFLYAVPLYLFCRDADYEINASNTRQVWWFLYVLSLLLLCVGAIAVYKIGLLFLRYGWAAYLGAVLYVIFPSNLVFLSPAFGMFTAETIVGPLLLWVVYVALDKESSLVRNIWGGAILGYCLLARAYLLLIPVGFIAGSFLFRDPLFARRLQLIACVALIVLLPWPIRNYAMFGDFSLSSQGGLHLWIANNAYARGSYDGNMYGGEGVDNPQKFPLLRDLDERYPGLIQMTEYSETQASRLLKAEALRWMNNNVEVLPWLITRKLAITFFPTNFENNNRVNVITAAVMLLFLPGVVLYGYRCAKGVEPRKFLLLALPIVCMCAVTAIYHAGYRLRYVMEPFLLLFAVYSVVHLVSQCRRSPELIQAESPLH